MNRYLKTRLSGIHTSLVAGHVTGIDSSSASKGRDRERFIWNFLQRILPPEFRFGYGDLIDTHGGRSGQIDIVIEVPFFPSMGGIDDWSSRLYPCEAVAAAIEVKSDIRKQWDEFERTRASINKLRTSAGAVQPNTNLGLFEHIAPLFGVGYTGWKSPSQIAGRVGHGRAAGILIIDRGIFCANPIFEKRGISSVERQPAKALWMFACAIFECAQAYRSIGLFPAAYADGDLPAIENT